MTTPSDPERGRLLAELGRALTAVPHLVPLDEARFLETHVLYEGRSDQQRRIIDWFGREMVPRAFAQVPFGVLSVGCGSGILDVPIAERLARAVPALDYTGVDPNALECEAFVARFDEAGLPQSAVLSVEACTFDDFAPARPFDLVHIVHCLYYLPDPREALIKARSLLAPGGQLVLVQAPCAALNQLSIQFYDKGYGRATLFADECATLMDQLGWRYRRTRIDAQLDVTPMFQRDSPVGLALRDFIVQFDTLQLPLEVQTLVDRYLDAIATPTEEGRVFISHPADIFVIAGP